MVVFGRVKKFIPRIRAFLPRARASLRRNRYGWVPIRRAPAAIWAQKIKLAKLIALVLVVVVLATTQNSHPKPLEAWPTVSTEWILPWLAGHHIGKPIEVTLRITSPVALFVDPDSLRQEGETLGNFEIRGRTGPYIYYVKEESEVRKVTEFNYTLQYLKPLGEGVFTERALPRTYFEYRYLRQYSPPTRVHWNKGRTHAEKTEIYPTKRVQPGDQPFPLAGEVPEGRRLGWIIKAIGAAIILAVPVFHLGRFIYTWRSRPRPVPPEPEVYPGDMIRELLGLWWQTGDYCYFLVAAVWARIWKKRILGLKPGALLPQDELWKLTTLALYSGKILPTSQVWEGFVLFLRLPPEADRKKDSEQPLPLPKPQRIGRWICRQVGLLRHLFHLLRRRLRDRGGKDEV